MTYRIIIHVGPWKTGSTALQEFFYMNRTKLLSHGILYPIGIVAQNAHHELPNTVSQAMSRFAWVPQTSLYTINEIAKSYIEGLNVNRVFTLLLSSEDFAGLNSEQFTEFIESFSRETDTSFELVYFDFDPEKRLESHQNQFIRQGEYVDKLALNQILGDIDEITHDFLAATKNIPATIHRFDYHQLKNQTDIFKRLLGLILNQHPEWDLSDWSIPIENLNISMSNDRIKVLNQFNKLNNEGRAFDTTCPLVYSSKYPQQSDRFKEFVKFFDSALAPDSALAAPDSALAAPDKMPKIKVFTSINTNYIDKAAVLWDSLKAESFEIEIITFLVEPKLSQEENDSLINLLKESSFPGSAYSIYDLPEEWALILQEKSVVESCTAIKASATNFLLDMDTELVIYFDPDILLYSDISHLIFELRKNSVSLTPHLLTPPTNADGIHSNEIFGSLRFGVFNLGFFAFTNTLDSKEVLAWWNSRLIKYCESKPESGIFTDQKWFDMSPAYFPQISPLRHPGYNVGPWNIENRSLSFSDGIYCSEGEPLIFFHFSSFDKPDLQMMLDHFDKSGLSLNLLEEYGRLLAGKKVLKDALKPCGISKLEVKEVVEPITQNQRILFNHAILKPMKKFVPLRLKMFLRDNFLK
jgi:hypothetical protein